jgi:hypothetical protein
MSANRAILCWAQCDADPWQTSFFCSLIVGSQALRLCRCGLSDSMREHGSESVMQRVGSEELRSNGNMRWGCNAWGK